MRLELVRIMKPNAVVKEVKVILTHRGDDLPIHLEPGDQILDCFFVVVPGSRRTANKLEKTFSEIAETRDSWQIEKLNLLQ